MRRCTFLSLLIVVLAACAPAAPTPTAAPSATPAATSTPPPTATLLPTLAPTPVASELDAQIASLRPEFADDVAALEGATRYWIEIEVEFDPDQQRASIDGLLRALYTNRSGRPLNELAFMLWPNHPQYRSAMSAGPALIAGQLVLPETELGGQAQRYPLAEPLAPDDSLDVSLRFRVETSGPIGFQAPRRFGITEGALFAPTFYPLLPRVLEGEWEVESAPTAGDTTNSEVAFYEVRVTADADYEIVTTGVEIERLSQADGRVTVTAVSGPARDFALAMGDFVQRSRPVGGVQVHGWALPQHASDLERMVQAAAEQLALLTRLIGPYPYTELDLVDVPGAFGGIEYPGLVSIGTLGSPNVLHPTIHEVGHQWFYGLVGDDQVEQPWLDEAAATYTEVLYLEEHVSRGTATGVLADFREQLRSHPNPQLPIGLPVEDFATGRDYALIVYRKGALFFDALRSQMGDEVFFAFLREYFEQYRYQIASAADFQQTAELTCGCDLQALFELWVYQGGPIPGL